jgi:hypothetical protein
MTIAQLLSIIGSISPTIAVGSLVLGLMACASSNSRQDKNVAIIPSPAPTLAPGEKPTFKVEVAKTQNGVRMVYVDFTGRLPAPEAVDKIFRGEFEKVVKKNPNQDALGYASLSCLQFDLIPVGVVSEFGF